MTKILLLKQNEKIALAKYANIYDLLVEPCAIFISQERPYFAASPDGVLGEETIIEVKCPYARRKHKINITTVPYLEQRNGILSLKKPAHIIIKSKGSYTAQAKHTATWSFTPTRTSK